MRVSLLFCVAMLSGCVVNERAEIAVQRGRCEARGAGWAYTTTWNRSDNPALEPRAWTCVRIDSSVALPPVPSFYGVEGKP